MNYESLVQSLSSLVASNASIEECETFISTLYSGMGDLFTSILSNEDILQHICNESFLHQSDFNRFVLHHDKQLSWRIRLNVWWPERVAKLRQSTNVHNHVWDHTSAIVAGILENHLFELRPGTDLYCYRSRSKGTPAEQLEFVGQKSAIETNVLIRSAGESYLQHHTDFHKIIPSTDFLATFCFQTPPKTDLTYALTSEPQHQPTRESYAIPTVDQVRQLLVRAIERINHANTQSK
jgi:hypothetical protein